MGAITICGAYTLFKRHANPECWVRALPLANFVTAMGSKQALVVPCSKVQLVKSDVSKFELLFAECGQIE